MCLSLKIFGKKKQKERKKACVRLTCTLRQWGARADVDAIYPDVPSGAVHKVTLHHNLPQPKKRKDEEEEELGKVEGKRSERGRGRRMTG